MTRRIRPVLVFLAAAFALVPAFVSPLMAAGADKSTANPWATGEDPARLAARCALLDDPKKVAHMDGLLTELIYVCGRFELLGTVRQESEEGAQTPLGAGAPDRRVNDVTSETSSRVQNETALAYNETTGTICSGFNDSFSGVTLNANFTGFSRSTDGGDTWSDRGQLAPPAGQRSFGDPAIVWRKSDAKFYMAALHSSGGLGFWRSDDDCQTMTWVGLASANTFDDKELLAVDNTEASPYYGRIYLSWTDFNLPGTQVVVKHTTDGGGSWTVQQSISLGGAPQGAWPAVAPNGNVYITWVDRDSDAVISDQVVRSTNGGVNWGPVANHPAVGVVSPLNGTASGNCGRPALNGNLRYLPSPQLVVGPDNVLHIVYTRDPDTQGVGDVIDVYYRRSTNYGDNWSTEVRLNDDATTNDQFFPAIVIGPNNIVGVGWYDRRDDVGNLRLNYYATTSYDGGLTWEPNVRLSDVDSPVVLDGELAGCYHGDYDTHIQTASHFVRQWGDDRPDGSPSDNSNVYTEREAISTDFLVLSSDSQEEICVGSPATYPISVPQFQGFAEQVTLSATGNPGATTALFSPNPVTPPGASTLTIDNTGGLGFGTFPITVTGTSSPGGIVHTSDVQLKVFTAAPNPPVLSLPADDAIDVLLKPVLDWSSLTQAMAYDLEVATDVAFTNIVYAQVGVTGSTHTLETLLDPETEYFWRARGTNVCGIGAYAAPFSFTTRAIPPVLLVDDDDNGPDVQSVYTTEVNAVSPFDTWDVTVQGSEPTLSILSQYEVIIWFSGDRFTFPTPSAGPQAQAEADLGTFLDGGGGRCVFISSQDYLWDMGGSGHNVPTAFMQNYLGVAAAGNSSDNGDYTSVTGQNLYSGLGPNPLTYPFTDFSDRLAASVSGLNAWQGNNGFIGAVYKSLPGAAKGIFWSFPFEAMAPAARNAALERIFEVCGSELFIDGFESGNYSEWSSFFPAP